MAMSATLATTKRLAAEGLEPLGPTRPRQDMTTRVKRDGGTKEIIVDVCSILTAAGASLLAVVGLWPLHRGLHID